MHNENISDAKKRVISLLDEKSFIEVNELRGEGVIAGYGTIGYRPVCVFSQDASFMLGALTTQNIEKICDIIDMAVKTGVPLIGFYDSIGAKIDEGSGVLVGIQKILAKLSNASGVIPQIAIVSGTIAGIATFATSFSDFVFMIDGTSKMFINSPQVLIAKTGMEVLAESVGGAKTHFDKTGSCDFLCVSQEDCIDRVKELLRFLPDNNLVDSDVVANDETNRADSELLDDNIDVNSIISSVCDENKFFEVSSGFAKNIIVGFSRMGGKVIGIVANNIRFNDGKLNGDAIKKASRFVKFCDSFSIPIVTLIDNDGFEESIEEELNGAIDSSAKLLFAYSDATTVKINVIFGKAFGGAPLMMGTSADLVLAWDRARISVVEPVLAVNVLYSEEIANSESPVEFREGKLRDYLDIDCLPENAVKGGFVNSIISPLETRKRIISALDMFSSKRENKIPRKHESVGF